MKRESDSRAGKVKSSVFWTLPPAAGPLWMLIVPPDISESFALRSKRVELFVVIHKLWCAACWASSESGRCLVKGLEDEKKNC